MRVFSLLTLGVAACAAGSALGAPAAKKMPFASGRVTYEMKSPMLNGSSKLSWIESGKKFRQDTKGTANLGQRQMSMESWAISDGTHLYMHQPMLGKQVRRMKIPKDAAHGPEMPGMPTGKNAGKVVGKGTVLGKPCEIRQVGSAKVWLWQGLMMKMETEGAQSVRMVATKVETNAKLPATLFKVPSGYEIKDQELPAAGKLQPH
jgi:hypothetical protein